MHSHLEITNEDLLLDTRYKIASWGIALSARRSNKNTQLNTSAITIPDRSVLASCW